MDGRRVGQGKRLRPGGLVRHFFNLNRYQYPLPWRDSIVYDRAITRIVSTKKFQAHPKLRPVLERLSLRYYQKYLSATKEMILPLFPGPLSSAWVAPSSTRPAAAPRSSTTCCRWEAGVALRKGVGVEKIN
jgi:hypothetical protein